MTAENKKKEKLLTRDLRVNGYSHATAANELGVSVTAVSQWAAGVHRISYRHVNQLKDMGVSQEAIENPSKEV